MPHIQLKKAMSNTASHIEKLLFFGYNNGYGYIKLNSIIKTKLEARYNAGRENVMITSGALHAIQLCIGFLGQDAIIISNHAVILTLQMFLSN